MFTIGEVIVYSEHGLCRVDDIREKTISDETKTYYELHPLDQENLIISVPIDSKKVLMLKTLDRESALEIIATFQQPGIEWIDDPKLRSRKYNELIHSGDRSKIARIASTLMRKNLEMKANSKKLYDQDRKLLQTIQNILFHELALSLGTTVEEIDGRIDQLLIG
ncbi:CarD family transcriptional regulator [Pseudoneobacillus sp. C159]